MPIRELVQAFYERFWNEVDLSLAEGDRAAAKVRFSGLHTGEFLGYAPTGRHVEWIGAAFFTADEGTLNDIWVLGDVESLRSQLAIPPA